MMKQPTVIHNITTVVPNFPTGPGQISILGMNSNVSNTGIISQDRLLANSAVTITTNSVTFGGATSGVNGASQLTIELQLSNVPASQTNRGWWYTTIQCYAGTFEDKYLALDADI